MPRNYRNLVVWQKSVRLAREVLRLTRSFPRDQRWELVTQMNRAAVSVAANIAEGAGKGSDREFLHGLHIARGSLAELDTQLVIASAMGFVASDAPVMGLSAEVELLLNSMIASVRRNQGRPRP